MGEWKKEGEEILTKDTPPKNGFWTPLRLVRFPPASGVIALFVLHRNPRLSTPDALSEGSENFSRGCVVWFVFLPPYVLHPPISWPKHTSGKRATLDIRRS